MDDLRRFLITNWLAVALSAAGLACGAWGLWSWRRRGRLQRSLWPAGIALALLAAGALGLSPSAGAWLAGAAALGLFAALLAVVITGRWLAPVGYALAGLLLFGLGGVAVQGAGEGLADACAALLKLEAAEPAWLLLLLLVPVVVALSFRSLAGLGPARRWVAISLRCLLVTLLTLALAEPRIRHTNETVTVLFVVDRSLSVPEEWAASPDAPGQRVDRRWERVRRFINEAVEKRGSRRGDKVGVIAFGRRPRLELPPAEVPRLGLAEITSAIDSSYTDIGAALKLALASFPEGTGKRIVLVSDGNENVGNAEEQARIARNNGVQIDVVPLAAGYRNESEVLVQSVEAPPLTEQSSQVPIRVLLRSYNPHTVAGLLTLRQIAQDEVAGGKVQPQPARVVPPSPMRVTLRPGLNSFSFRQALTGQPQAYTYEAVFQPTGVLDDDGRVIATELAGDRTENNRATTHVIARGQRRLLLVEPKDGDHRLLFNRLQILGEQSKFHVESIEAAHLPKDKDVLGVFLSKYDCVILANVPAEMLGDEQQEMIRSNTCDQGCGLIMIGGPEGFGAGGWQGTSVEKALPVDCEIKALKVQGKGGLVLIMHASEMADGNRWQKEIAKLAIKKLSPVDEVGMLYYDFGGTRWHIPLQAIGGRRDSLLRMVDKMIPGDMPEFDTGLQMAFDGLTDPKRELATKHVIVISDGDPTQSNVALLARMKQSRVTVTTVGVATHGAPQDQALARIAAATGGRFYSVKSPSALPAIYIRETRLVSQSFIDERRIAPQLLFKSGPTERLPDELPPLYGYVRTTRKEAFPPVQVPVRAPAAGDQEFPILAYWNYGLGKSAAFTSDARSQPEKLGWDRDWAESDIYLKFWEQVVNWSLRAVETGQLNLTTEYRDGKVRVTVDARDTSNRPLTDLRLRGAVTQPSAPGKDRPPLPELRFEQKNSGVYEAEFKADEAGSYFINAQAFRPVRKVVDGREVAGEEVVDGARTGVTVPYSPEFADLESNAPLMEKLRALTGGQSYADEDAALAQAARSGDVFRLAGLPPSRNLQPVWYWLLLAAAVVLFFDVAVRRIALDPREAAAAARRGWERLRRRETAAEAVPVFLERLKNRKAQVGEALDREHSARRFDAGAAPTAPPPPGAHEMPTAAAPRPTAAPKSEPQPEGEAADFTGRLLKAKQRVWEEREKEK
jgi:uncharacterized membrane protein/Mg-chelatase subunit ChlD